MEALVRDDSCTSCSSDDEEDSEYMPDSSSVEDSFDNSDSSEAAKEPDPSDTEIAAQSKQNKERESSSSESLSAEPDPSDTEITAQSKQNKERESSSSESLSAESEVNDNKSREKKRCPIKKCGAGVIHLPRHLRMVHKWSAGSARMAVNCLGLRKKRTAKRERPVRNCPIDGCCFRGPRLDNHLVFQHGHDRKTKEYLSLLKSATKVVSGQKRKSNSTSKQPIKKTKLAGKSTPKLGKTQSPLGAPKQQKKKMQKAVSGILQTNMSSTVSSTSGASKHIPVKELRLAGGSRPESNNMSESPPSEAGTLNLFSDSENEGDSENGSNEIAGDELGSDEVPESPDDLQADEMIEDTELLSQSESTPDDIVKEFFEWLQSADGGLKAERNAKQYSDQVRLVMKNSGEGDKMKWILDKLELRQWVKNFEKKTKPGTIKSYIISVRMFITFLICEHKVKGDQINQARKVKEILTQWSSTLQKAVKKRFWEKRVEDMQRRITPDQIRQFEKSEPARRAITVLGQCEENEFSQQDYCITRDFLMTELLINNGQRSGAICNMTLEEFEGSSEDGDHYVVMVKDHKTALTYGPATLILSPTLQGWMKIFSEHMRSKQDTSNSKGLFFISLTGKPMTSSTVSSAINSIWVKSNVGNNKQGRVSATSFRKAAVSEVYRTDKSFTKELSHLMSHNVKTAEKYYSLEERGKANVATSRKLAGIMRGKSSDTVSPKKPGAVIKGVEEIETAKDDTPPPDSKRKEFSSDDLALIKQIFAKNIDSQSITIIEVKEKIAEYPSLHKESPKRIYDKVRSEWRYKNSMGTKPPVEVETKTQIVGRLFDEDKDDNDNYSVTVSSQSKGKNVFYDDEKNVLVSLFKDMVNGAPVHMDKVQERLSNDERAKEILKRFSLKQLVNKVRFERAQKLKGKR